MLSRRDEARAELKAKLALLEDVLSLHDSGKFTVHDDPIFQVMKIRKGKKLIARSLPFLRQVSSPVASSGRCLATMGIVSKCVVM